MKTLLTEVWYPTLPDTFPDTVDISVYRALNTGKKGLAVSLYLKYINSLEGRVTTEVENKLSNQGAIKIASNWVENLLKNWGDEISRCKVRTCACCSKDYLPFKKAGVAVIETMIGSGGIPSQAGKELGTFERFICQPCIDKEIQRCRDAEPDIYPPPFESWPGWAKEAFGKRE